LVSELYDAEDIGGGAREDDAGGARDFDGTIVFVEHQLFGAVEDAVGAQE